MAQNKKIKITMTIEASAFSLAHAAIDAMDAKLREHGGRVVTGRLKPAASFDADGNKHFSLAKEGPVNFGWTPTEAQPLQKWVVLYTRIPTNYNPQQKLVVEAATEADAREIVREHIGDRGKQLSTYAIEDTKPYEPLAVAGRVVGGAL
jgi:hypothetical protein